MWTSLKTKLALILLHQWAKKNDEITRFLAFAQAQQPNSEFMFSDDSLADEVNTWVRLEGVSAQKGDRDMHVHTYRTIFPGVFLKSYITLTFRYSVYVVVKTQ